MTGSSLARRIALVGLVALVASLVTATAAFAQDPPTLVVTDLEAAEASDNVGSSIRISQYTFASADEALIGRDDLFADSLASGSLQGGGRPLLLTPGDALDTRVTGELERLGATTVHILGGVNAVSEDVVGELEDAGYTVGNRFEGETRTETAIDIAEFTGGDTAILVRSHEDPTEESPDATQAFADSLAAGGWAAETGWPVLFTYPPVEDNPETEADESAPGITPSTAAHIADAGYSTVHIVGGEEAVAASVEAELADLGVGTVNRVEGPNRFATAVAVANERGFADSSEAELTIVAEGQGSDGWVGGFASAALAGLTPAPIILANNASEDLPPETAEFIVAEDVTPPVFAQDPGADHTLNPHGRTSTGEVAVCMPEVNNCDDVAAEFGVPLVVAPVPGDANIDPTTVAAGGTVTLTIPSGVNVGDEVDVQGCGYESGDVDHTVTEDDIDEDGAFTLDIVVPAPGSDFEGDSCELTVIINGTTYGPFTITITEPLTNQDFGVSPAGEQLIELTDAGAGGSRDFVFSGIESDTVDVAFFECDGDGSDPGVVFDGNTVTFRDTDFNSSNEPDDLADDPGSTSEGNASIVSTDGDPVLAGSTYLDEVAVGDDGTLTVRVTSMAEDCAFLAVFSDADDDDELDLDENNEPSEAFGVAGPLVWYFGEAPVGYDMETDVMYVNRDGMFWVDVDGELIRWGRDNDRYFLDCFGDALEISEEEWRAWLSEGDNTSDDVASYNPNGPNQFENEGDDIYSPAGQTVEIGDFDAAPGTAANDARVTVIPSDPPGGLVEDYTVEAYDADTGALVQTETTDDPDDDDVVFENLAAGEYFFRTYATSACGNSGDSSDPTFATVATPPPGPVAGAPISVAASAQDGDSSATLTPGDILTVRFDQTMDEPDANDTVEVTDGDGTIADIINGVNSTWTLSDAGDLITITMTAGPAITTTGGTIGVQYPAEATASSGVTDADEGLEWDLAGSTDTTF